MTVRMGFPMGVPNGNPMGMRNKTPTWEWEWDGVLVNVDGYGNDSYSHGKNSHGFFNYGRKFVQHCAIPSYPTAQVYRQLGCTNVKSGHFRLIERLAGRPAGRNVADDIRRRSAVGGDDSVGAARRLSRA